jgi:hypothetical protein
MKAVKTAEEWIKIESLGTWECDLKNGSVWTFNGKHYYLSHLELDPLELILLASEMNQ